MNTLYLNSTAFETALAEITADTPANDTLLQGILLEVRSAYASGALSSADFDRLTGTGLNKLA